MEDKERIAADALLAEIKIAIKDTFIAAVRKSGDGLQIKFPNGQTFTLALWENQKITP